MYPTAVVFWINSFMRCSINSPGIIFSSQKSSSFSRKIWVNSQSWRIAKVEYYTSESKKDKTLYVSDFIKKNGFSIAGRMVMEKENGNKTVMEVMSYKPDIGLQDEVFTKDFLLKK